MRRDDAWLLDMVIAARKAIAFTSGMSPEGFLEDEAKLHAVIRMVQIIGEAASRVSEDTRKSASGVPWPQIIALRHRLVHDYVNVNPVRIWEIVQTDLPKLIAALGPYVPPEEK